jgi:hypothetical protein
MKKFELWYKGGYHEDGLDRQRIIPSEDIEKAIWAESYVYAKKEEIEKYLEINSEYDGNIIDYFEENDIEYSSMNENWYTEKELKHIEENGNALFDVSYNSMFEADDLEYEKTYTYWDGNNHRTISADGSETEITISDKSICLDEWDGNNHRSGSKFCHDYIYRVLEIDGEQADDNTYLLWQESQYQGDQPVGTLVSTLEIERHIENLNEVDGAERDIDDYIKKIEAIEAK